MGDECFIRQSGIAAATATLLRFLLGPVNHCRRRHYFPSEPCNTAHTTEDLDTVTAAFKLLLESALERHS
jgi:hypothetical protein